MKRILSIALFAPLAALAQDTAAQDQATKLAQESLLKTIQSVDANMIGPGRAVLTAPVTGAPYSADEVTTFNQTLGDGTHIQREDKVTVYRDGQGRLRRESPTGITISDPVAGVAYTLDPNKLTARKTMVAVRTGITCFDTPGVAGGCGNMASESFRLSSGGPGEPNTLFYFTDGSGVSHTAPADRQSLGSQTIEGVLSQGTSTTETIPAGAIGNDREIHVVNERWFSPELKTTTMTKHSDPRTGEEIFRLTNIRRGEPSPDLFQLPAGYQLELVTGVSAKKRQ